MPAYTVYLPVTMTTIGLVVLLAAPLSAQAVELHSAPPRNMTDVRPWYDRQQSFFQDDRREPFSRSYGRGGDYSGSRHHGGGHNRW